MDSLVDNFKNFEKINDQFSLVRNSSKNWFLADDINCQVVKLYTEKEVASELSSTKIKNTTLLLCALGIFSEKHVFIYYSKQKKKKYLFWTDDGVAFLSQLFKIEKKEEEEYISKYYFVHDSIGKKAMFSLIREIYSTVVCPGSNRTIKSIEDFMSGSWGHFEQKDKGLFDIYFYILGVLVDKIQKKEKMYYYHGKKKEKVEVSIDQSIKMEDYVL